MTPQEIKKQVDMLYDEIDKALHQGIFVLNPRIAEIYDQITELEDQCAHEYNEHNQCKYCYHVKED
jgi:hypothetical protein